MNDFPTLKEIMQHNKFASLIEDIGLKDAKLLIHALSVEGKKPYLTEDQEKRLREIKERVK